MINDYINFDLFDCNLYLLRVSPILARVLIINSYLEFKLALLYLMYIKLQ